MNYELEKAKKELYKFLDENPEMIPMQNVLNDAMDNSENRILALAFFVSDNLQQLKTELQLLQIRLNQLIEGSR